jgi:aspartate 1-decarboxylase
MKKFQCLGKDLSREDQKQIMGGKISVICTCNGSDLYTTVCYASTFKGTINCLGAASSYCQDNGYFGTSCDVNGAA